MKRQAFALLEVLLVVGIVGIVGMFGVPLYQQMQFRNDLAIAKNQIIQGLQSAKTNAMANKDDSVWTFYVPQGVLFAGTSYDPEVTNAASTVVYTMPQTVRMYGLTEVTYDKQGNPDQTGIITLAAYNNEVDTVQVVLSIAQGTVTTTVGNSMSICYEGSTLSIDDAAWPDYQDQGATLGPCPSASSSSAASAASSAATSSVASSASSSSSSSSSSGGMGGTDCANEFSEANNVLTTLSSSDLTFTNIAALRQYGTNGPYIPTHYCYSTDNGSNYTKMFSGNGTCTGNNGNAYGNAVNTNGSETSTVNLATNAKIVIKVRWRYQTHGWLAVNDILNSKNDANRFVFLKKGDNPTTNSGYWSQPSLKNLLQSRGYLDGAGKVNITCNERILAAEAGTMPGDFNDAVMLLHFQ